MLRILSIDIGTRNMALCGIKWDLCGLTSRKWSTVELIQWENIDMDQEIRRGQKRKPLIRDYIDYLVTQIRATIDENCYDAVVIENQMRAKFQIIAHAIYTIVKAGFPHVIVGFCSARLKLQCDVNNFTNTVVDRPTKNHAHRKKVASDLTTVILSKINATSDMVQKFKNAQKQDDLSDSLLQAIRILQQL